MKIEVVDKTLEVVDEYQHKILKLEQKVLIRSNIKTVRYRTFIVSSFVYMLH